MDDIDARIVAFLVRDARASYALIGGEVGLSAPAVKRRVDRLRATGAITGFSARVDPAAMGWTTEGYVELYCGSRTSPEEIGMAVRRYPEVVDACTITGEADALIHIRATDVRHFEGVGEDKPWHPDADPEARELYLSHRNRTPWPIGEDP